MNLHKHLALSLILCNFLFGFFGFQEDKDEQYEEEVYLSFRYQGVIDEIIIAYYSDGNFYLPLTELFDLFAINYELSISTLSISGKYLNQNTDYIIDFTRRYARVKEKVYSISANDFKVKEVDFFVTPDMLGEIFGLNLTVDLSRLTIRLETDQELPIITRHTRRYKEQLRQKYGGQSNLDDYELLAGREYRTLAGAMMDYSLYASASESNKFANLNLSLAGEILFGDVQGKLNSSISQDTSTFEGSDLRWRFSDESQPWFSTLSMGQVNASGLTSQTIQGASITNQPLTPKRSYDTYSIDGVTDPEAEVELYQNNNLVEVIHADEVGYYRFLVPLNYGTSDFKIRIYAKQGRVIELDHRVQIPFNFLPKGEVRYDLSAGRLVSESIPWSERRDVGQASASMGIKNWLTVGLGLEYIQDNYEDRPAYYGKLSSRLAGDILLGLDFALNNFYKLSMRGIGPNNSTLSMDYTFFDQQNLYNTQDYKHQFIGNLFYPFQIGDIRFTGRGSGTWVQLPNEDRFNLSADINQFLRGFRLRYGIREQHTFGAAGHNNSSQIQVGAVYIIPRIPSYNILLRGSYFSTDLSYNSSIGELGEIKFQYIKQFNARLKGQLLTIYDLIQQNAFFEIGVTLDLDVTRSNSTIRTIGSTPSFTQTVRGSAGFDKNDAHILWDNRQQVGRAGVTVRMFVDEDNSGTYDDGEEIIPGNALSIERSSSRQLTRNGIAHLTQLQPYRRYNFRVNEARINNPMLVAGKKKFSIITDPNRYKQVDVPFFTTGVIDGRVERVKDGNFLPIAGLKIHVKNEDGGYEVSLRTFSDGSYYS
ncbi:fimbria/pilus outer membrane usher protein, partial [bacterium]|nr:fimbria/pilus outer membrane usher protein [bacterium]